MHCGERDFNKKIIVQNRILKLLPILDFSFDINFRQ